jgi:hypothetical protein
MGSIFNFFAFLFALNFALAANELKMTNVLCKSYDESLIQMNCTHDDTTVSYNLNILRNFSNILVTLANLTCRRIFLFIFAFQINFNVYKIEKGKRKIMNKQAPIDWCQEITKTVKQSFFTKFLFKLSKQTMPELIQKCPYKGLFASK